eukprot:354334-Chlamydomonas_euryale.AAC.4
MLPRVALCCTRCGPARFEGCCSLLPAPCAVEHKGDTSLSEDAFWMGCCSAGCREDAAALGAGPSVLNTAALDCCALARERNPLGWDAGSAWLCMAPHDSGWLCIALRGSAWLHMTLDGPA